MTYSYSVQVNHSVGEICGMIIESNVRLVGMRYKSRVGTDGKSHICPNFFLENFQGDLTKWWNSNNKKSLTAMQLEVLEWRMQREEEIGFPNDVVRNKIMDELLKKRDELKSLKDAG